MELSKANKKAARQIIEIGLQNEFRNGLTIAAAVIKEWESKGGDNKEYYYSLYSKIKDFDKHIARRYDAMKSSDYLFIMAAQLREGFITESDLAHLSEDVRQQIQLIIKIGS
jgi:hypothetical protein